MTVAKPTKPGPVTLPSVLKWMYILFCVVVSLNVSKEAKPHNLSSILGAVWLVPSWMVTASKRHLLGGPGSLSVCGEIR